MKSFFSLCLLGLFVLSAESLKAQPAQYKIRQVTNTMGMRSEVTVYVKNLRKRTEGGGIMGFGANIVTIEQCDLQRTVKLNDKKKVYYIEPFAKDDEVIEEDEASAKPAPKKPVPKATPKKGGTVYMYYNITDTGERKKMFGFTARHVWTTQKIKPSADACMMKDSLIMRTDGWYIDLPQFNCPISYRPRKEMFRQGDKPQPECQDRFVTRRSGKGKLGFALIEKMSFQMGNENARESTFETNLETLEMSTAKLDSMLFEIPPGYAEVKSEEELQDKMDMGALMGQVKNMAGNIPANPAVNGEKPAGTQRIGVLAPTGSGEISPATLQQHLAGILIGDKVQAVAVADEAEARQRQCDFLLSTEFVKIKQAGKVGSLLKAIKNSDPNAATSFNIEASLTLRALGDGSVKTQPRVDGKFDGKADEAARRALDEGGRQVMKALR